MEGIPPEVLQMILGCLTNPRDLYCAYMSFIPWRDFLNATKSSWLFSEAFPHFALYLQKSEVLQCRSVCKMWCFGVDYFLENNPTVRPTFEDTWMVGSYKTDSEVDSLRLYFEKQEFIFGSPKEEGILNGLDRMLREIPNYPKSYPIVGRSFEVFWTPDENDLGVYETEAGTFLCAFGQHIWFLSIRVENLTPLQTLTAVFDLMFLSPNLKKLSVYTSCRESGPISAKDAAVVKCMRKARATQKILGFSNLETLDLRWTCVDLQQILLAVLDTKNLQGLHVDTLPPDDNFEAQNIVDLSLKPNSYPGMLQALKLKSPVRRLFITLNSCTTIETTFRLAKHFRMTLRNFCFEVTFLKGRSMYRYPNISVDERCFLMEPFSKVEMLQNFPQLKSVTVHGIMPISLNFLCGLGCTLEYLNISKNKLPKTDKLVPPFVDKMRFKEELDLLDLLKQICVCTANKRIVYQSNIWKLFPKLRVLNIELVTDGDNGDN